MKRILIDGYNQLFKHTDGENLEQKRQQFITDTCFKYKNFKGLIYIVFDGLQKSPSLQNPAENIRLLFSSRPEEADDIICNLIEKHQTDEIEVITRDQKIIDFAKAYQKKTRAHVPTSPSKKKKKTSSSGVNKSLEDHENILFRLALKMNDDNEPN